MALIELKGTTMAVSPSQIKLFLPILTLITEHKQVVDTSRADRQSTPVDCSAGPVLALTELCLACTSGTQMQLLINGNCHDTLLPHSTSPAEHLVSMIW
jgi:hypothetical protein